MKHSPISLIRAAALTVPVLLAAIVAEAAAQNSSLMAVPAERVRVVPLEPVHRGVPSSV